MGEFWKEAKEKKMPVINSHILFGFSFIGNEQNSNSVETEGRFVILPGDWSERV